MSKNVHQMTQSDYDFDAHFERNFNFFVKLSDEKTKHLLELHRRLIGQCV